MDIGRKGVHEGRMEGKLNALRVRPVERAEEGRYRELIARQHHPGHLPKIGHTLWYVATCGGMRRPRFPVPFPLSPLVLTSRTLARFS